MIDESILKKDELAIFTLRKLYSTHGYKKYKMRKFEEYDFYSENKDFLASDGVITFTDADGRLLALKPDVTLSILKNFKAQKGCVKRLYYNENVYRISETSHTYRDFADRFGMHGRYRQRRNLRGDIAGTAESGAHQ